MAANPAAGNSLVDNRRVVNLPAANPQVANSQGREVAAVRRANRARADLETECRDRRTLSLATIKVALPAVFRPVARLAAD